MNSISNLKYPQEFITISVVEYGIQTQATSGIVKQYSNACYYFLPQKPLAIARNFLVEQVQENFIAYVDANVILDINWATQCLKAIEEHSIAATGGPVHYEGNNFIKKAIKSYCRDFNTLETIKEVGHLNTAAVLIKKKSLKKVGLFDIGPRRIEGFNLTYKLLFYGLHIASCTQAIARVTQSENTFSYIIGQFFDGYFQAKTLLKYKVHIRPRKILTFTDNLWPLSITGTVIWTSRIMKLTGWAIGKLRLCNVKESAPKRYNDGELYCLNPSPRVFLRTNDVLIIDIVNGSTQTIKNYQGKILAAAMPKSIFFQQLFGSFIQSRILIRVNLEGNQA